MNSQMIKHLFCILCCYVFGIANLNAWAVMPYQSTDKTLGTVNCANSLCHGSTVPWTASNVLQNEYTTWVRLDKHTQTYDVLLNDTSKRIAKNLGLEKPAHETKECVDCHAHNPPQQLRGERFVHSEGVGCEGCHGPAERWVKSHTLEGNTHADNLQNGMYPTDNPVAQAKLCLSCHFGDKNRFVNHRMMGAGHPRVSFELETFNAIQPAHYKIDADWHERKGDFNPIKVWAIGQVIATQQILDTFADPKLGYDGVFPELVLFDCHACHHPMSEKKWSSRLGIGPGKIRLNDSNMLMMRAIAKVVDPDYALALNKRINELHQVMAGNVKKSQQSPQQLAKQLSQYSNQLITTISKKPLAVKQLKQIFLALIDEANQAQFSDYAGAEQAYMAISDVALSLAKQNALNSAAIVNRHLAAMRKTLLNDEQYQPEIFAKQFADLRYAVSQAR